jgi:hypothetical protein
MILLAAVLADPVNLKSMACSDVSMFPSNFLLQAIHFRREELNRTAAFGADHVVMAPAIVLMLIAGDAVMKSDFARKTALGQQFQGAIDRGEADPKVLLLYQPVQLVSRKMFTSFQKGAQNGIALCGMFQSNTFEMTMQDALSLTDHLARDAGLVINAFL